MRKRIEQWINRISILVLAIAMVVSFSVFFGTETLASWNGTAAASFASGSGTEANPYVIETASQMGYFINQMDSGVTYEGLYIRIGANLDLTGHSWTYDSATATFNGHLDGQCYTITTSDTLLPDIGQTGVVQKLNLQGKDMRSDSILCVDNLGLIQLCTARGTVPAEGSGGSHVGLICETNYDSGIVRWCGAVGSASAAGNDSDAYAGMVAENRGTIDGCFAAISTSASAPGKYNDPYRHPLGNGQWGSAQTISNSYYDKTLYTLASTYGTGLTTEVMQSAEFLSMISGNTLAGTQWVTGSDGYPALEACGTGIAAIYGWEDESRITYNYAPLPVTLKASESGTTYFTTDGTDPRTSDSRKTSTSINTTISLSGDMTISSVLYSGGKYGKVTTLECIYMPGSGTESDPYQILTKKGLDAVRMDTAACYKLTTDLTFTEEDFAFGGVASGGWEPIAAFSGTFDGDGHIISGLYGRKGGLIDSNSGTITSLRMVDHNLFKGGRTGPIANYNSGSITRCYAKSAFTLTSLPSALNDNFYSESGGIAGYNYGNVSYCSVDGIVPGRQVTREGQHYIGGIVGNGSEVNNCISNALIVSDDTGSDVVNYIFAGGIGGSSTVYNSLSNASFYIDSRINYDCYIGGISGHFTNGYANLCVASDLDITESANSYIRLYKKAWGPTNSDCYKTSAGIHPESYPALDFETKWMATDTGIVPQGVMDADGHCFSSYSYTPETCTATGCSIVKCDLCGIIKTYTIPALGHKEVVDAAVETSCTAPGKTEGKHCSRCNLVITAQKEVAQLPHDYVHGICAGCKADCPAEVSGTYSSNLTWTFRKDTATLTISGSSSMERVYLNGLPWQEYIHSIEHLSLPEGLTYIGPHIFEDHTMLTSVTIPDNVSTVDSYAFSGCTALTSVDLGSGCGVNEKTFAGCPIQTLELGASTIFGPNAFDSDALTSITINGDGAWLDSGVFLNCTNLKEVHFTGSAPQYVKDKGTATETAQASFGDVTWYYDCNQSGWLTSARYNAAAQTWAGYPLVAEKHAEVIDEGTPATCTEPGISDGKHCSVCNEVLTAQTEIPALGHSFTDGVCDNCGLPGGKCGENVFWTLDAEGELVISGSGDMDNYSFPERCAPWDNRRSTIKTVVVKKGVASIGDNAFYQCSNLTNAVISDGVTRLGSQAFRECTSLTDITLPEGLTQIGAAAFLLCQDLTNLTIPESVSSIGGSAFQGCSSLLSIAIPEGITSLDSTFIGCTSLADVVLPQSLTGIDHSAFSSCTSLTNITIPENVTYIGDDAFRGCTGLVTVSLPQSLSRMGAQAFHECSSLISITIPEKITGISNGTFSYCSSLTSVTLPQTITQIGDTAFSCCSSLTSITIPDSVTSIGQSAFGDCSALKDITLPKNLTSISAGMFSRCTSLTEIIIPEGVTEIGSTAFYECTGLASITIPDRVTSIGREAFQGCGNLTHIAIPEGVTAIEQLTFFNCNSLIYITLPSTLENIAWRAFGDFYELDHVLFRGTSKAGITIASDNTPLTNATWHYNADGTEIQWLKNCENRGLFCSVCNDFITREKTTSGEHIFTGKADTYCDDCGFTQKLNGIAAVSFPEKKEYAVFTDALDASGGVLRLTYDKGAETTTEMTADMISGFDSSKLGYQSLTVTYGGFKQYYGVTVVPGTPDALEIAALPAKTTYMLGEELDTTGLALRAVYTGRGTIDLPVSYAEIAGVDMTTPGTKAVEVSVGGTTASFDITVQSSCVITCDPATYPESSHNYASNTDDTQTFTMEGARSLSITFSASTYTEIQADYLYVMDADGAVIAEYSGSQAANQTLTIPGDTFQIRLTSDSGVNKYGYSFSSITAVMTHHVFGDWVTEAAGCTQDGRKVRTCLGADCGFTETESIPAAGHKYDAPVFTWAEDYTCTAVFSCLSCSESQSVVCTVRSASGTSAGETVYTAKAVLNGRTYTDQKSLAHTTHTAGSQWYSDQDSHWKQCTICKETLEKSTHTPGAEATENTSQKCTVCGHALRMPLGLDWFTDIAGDSDSPLWASGSYARILEQYGSLLN